MPIYEYRCGKCGEFEVTQRITATPLKKCPTCRGKVTKLISSTSFQLKGSGWYVTDYGRSGSKGSNKGATETSGGSEKSDTAASKSEKSDSTASKSSDTKTTKAAAA